MTLGQKQRLFARLVARLLVKAHELGFEVALGEAKRSDEQAEINAIGEHGRNRVAKLVEKQFPALALRLRNNGSANGIRNSLHQDKLALDLDLFRDGQYQSTTEAHRPLGEWWETQNPLCRWGGRFGDGNHYSIEHDGRK